ncbi:hypothetical protein GGS24DRAFT_485374 [Hypoxylon argillaceum]|nr:hypothetical protein GGS24DRAFT_485374 [Hypoxylon argillaceum]
MSTIPVPISPEFDPSTGEFDIANTHDNNLTLSQKGDIKAFFKKMDKITKITEESIAWLGSIPQTMSYTAIPLFPENNGGTDFQVHPCYSRLGNFQYSSYFPNTPHFYVRQMTIDSREILVIPFGRLFINLPVYEPVNHTQTTSLSKWTGYEVFFGLDRRLWFVFDKRAFTNSWAGWYPVGCDIGGKAKDTCEQTGPSTLANGSDKTSASWGGDEVIKSQEFDSADVSLTGSTLSSITLAEVRGQIQRSKSEKTEVFICDAEEKKVAQEIKDLEEME